jgi:putative transposase
LFFASEDHWGYSLIFGELKKLGIGSLSKNTVKRIFHEGGFATGPKRGTGS